MSVLLLGVFLLPISPSLEIKNNKLAIGINKNEALAKMPTQVLWGPSVVKYDKDTKLTTITQVLNISDKGKNAKENFNDARKLYMVVYKLASGQAEPPEGSKDSIKSSEYTNNNLFTIPNTNLQTFIETQTFNLEADNKYLVLFILTDGGYDPYDEKYTYAENKRNIQQDNNLNVQGVSQIISLNQAEIDGGDGTITTDQTVKTTTSPLQLGCSVFNIGGCIAQIFYLFFTIAAFVGELAGRFLDFFVYYSTDSGSYVSDFISMGWKAIRDVSNIFFIIALLYVAIKTILGLDVTNNKKIVGTIVLIALIINFSLFFTKIIIDSTNILGRIFYNSISVSNQNTVLGGNGETSISVALISKFSPQELVTQDLVDTKPGGIAMFIFITLLATAVVLYAAYIFFVVGILFVSRVVSLWIYMIFSPIAFASYTLPFDIPGFGHKEWWSEVLKNSFLAPIFIFFLYIITMFAGFLNTIVTYSKGTDSSITQKAMAVVIPFIILIVLLMKAKELAVKFSGEMGAAIVKGAQMVGGLALGAATGGAAMLGSSVVGGAASKVMGKWGEKLKSGGYTTDEDGKVVAKKGMGSYLSRMALKSTDKATKSTFDVRKTALGSSMSKVTGMDFQSAKMIGLGSKEGGFAGKSERYQKKLEKESELFKTKMNDDQVKDWSAKNQEEYTAKMNAEKNKAQNEPNFDEQKWQAEYEEKHKKPKEYSSAASLNADRQQAYIDNIGDNSLLSSLAYTLTVKPNEDDMKIWEEKYDDKLKAAKDKAKKKEGVYFTPERERDWEKNYIKENGARPEKNINTGKYSEKEIIKATQEKAKKTKIVLGAAALVGTGGLGVAAGAVYGANAGINYMSKESGQKAAKATIQKEINTLGKLETRIKELKDSIAGFENFLENGNKVSKDANGDPTELRDINGNIIEFVTGDKNVGFKVDQNKVDEALANVEISIKENEARFTELARNGLPVPNDLKENLKKFNIEKTKLTKLKTSIKDLNSAKNQLYTTDKDKAAASKKDDHGGQKSNPNTQPATIPNTHHK